ncbi:6-hydroxymethylpterin diphosphokinase MptE-like protein [Haloplanus sp. GCM10025708]|uniref:6-hydroxymethylpterin diphosphokinase MptE-like protein n=1 Tax=Haloferacaceae TaxID=1644056 RepID=UPI00360617BF
MNFAEWEPVYERILSDFGYDRAADERARDVLAGYARPFDRSRLDDVADATVAVAGAGPSLVGEVDRAASADFVFAASTAADVLRDAGVAVDVMVTDLDKNPETAAELSRRGVPVAVHAHGDNVAAIDRWLPEFDVDDVLATTQARPVDAVVNPGGFTDGDRAAFLADELAAGGLRFVGWDFDDPSIDAAKRKKLAWAERLLAWLESRRDDRFDVLDGRRAAIEPIR